MSKKHQQHAKKPREPLKVECYVKRGSQSATDNPLQDGFYESEDILIDDGVIYERTDDVRIDLNSIPEHVKLELAAATLELVENFMRQPGAREFLNKQEELRKKSTRGLLHT